MQRLANDYRWAWCVCIGCKPKAMNPGGMVWVRVQKWRAQGNLGRGDRNCGFAD